MSDITPIFGISQGQANEIIFAYENDKETQIVLDGMDLHFFSKRKRDKHKKLMYIKCFTLHSKYLNFAIYDYSLRVVGSKRNKYLLKINANKNDKESLSIFIR